MATCLVTGASGFIGSHLVELLASRGDSIRCLVRSTSDTKLLRELGVELREADLIGSEPLIVSKVLESAVADVDVVYHVAGVVHSPRPAEQIRVNRDGVTRLLEACARQADPPRVVLVSSIAATGPVARGKVRTPSDAPAPVSDYGRSKLAGEVAAQAWAEQVPIIVVRPGIVFGPRDRNMLPLFLSVSRFRVHAVPTLRPPRLSMIHVADLVELLTRCAAGQVRIDPPGTDLQTGRGYYFACAPEYPTYGELGSLLAAAVGRKHIVRLPMPGLMPWIVAGVNEAIGRLRGRSSALRIDKIREAKAPCWACSGDTAQRDFAFTPAKPLVERLKETALWYREQGML